MSTYRIYVGSRGKSDGADTDFTFELPYTIATKEKSLAMIDVACDPTQHFNTYRKTERYALGL